MSYNIQDMTKSAVAIFQKIQELAAQTVGLNTLWCRATPVENSEDIILHEYTLMHVGLECPKPIKVVTSQGDYNPGNFSVDLFNISYDAPLEINVPIAQWRETFGENTMPQKGDVVYVELYHKLYSVLSSTVMYTAVSHPMYFKCSLGKYTMTVDNTPVGEFRETINEMTVSEKDLFGKPISEEVADAVTFDETNYSRTTSQDRRKTFDMSSIVAENIVASDGNIVAHAYYSMLGAEEPVVYHFDYPVVYSPESEKFHWIFTCWFRLAEDPTVSLAEKPLRIFRLYQRDKRESYFRVSTQLKLSEGDTVTVTRGRLISVRGEVVKLKCESGFFVKIPAAEMSRADRLLTGWHETGVFKISKVAVTGIFRSTDGTVEISMDESSSSFTVRFGKFSKEFKAKKSIDFTKWAYVAVDFSKDGCRLIMQQRDRDGMDKVFMNPLIDSTLKNPYPKQEFSVDSFTIDAVGTRLQICNIRLYENEYPLDDAYRLDMMSKVTRNESKCIVVDAPNVPDDSMFFSPVR